MGDYRVVAGGDEATTQFSGGGHARSRFLAPPPERRVEPGATPTFSVIVAAYQAADVIGEALDSALRQTSPPHEIIVCDDGSTDRLDAALRPYRDRIDLLRKEHGGEASAKNAAAAVASGEFVVILDADDIFMPTRLEALADLAAARPDLDILTTDAWLEVDGRRVRRCYDGGWTFEVDDQRREILQRNFIFGAAAVRRERLVAAGGFDESILWTTDWDCWLRLILEGASVGAVNEPLALYRLREASLSAQRGNMLRGKLATLEKARSNPHLRPGDRSVLERAIAGYRRELAFAEVERALQQLAPGARRRAAAVALGRGVGIRARCVAGAYALAPGVAGRRLREREAGTWVGAGGIRVRRSSRPSRPVRVVLYTDAREIGGAERSLENLVAALSPRIEVAVLGADRDVVDLVASARPGTPAVVVPFVQSRWDVRGILAHARALLAFRPDIVHANLVSPWSCQPGILLALLMPRVRVIAVQQLPSSPHPPSASSRRLAKLLSRRLDAHVAVGEGSARELERLLGLRHGSVRTVHNGVGDLERQPCTRFAEGPTIGSVGRIERQKGYDVLLRALTSLPGTTAVLVGDGSERRSLQALADELGIADRLVWPGWSSEPRLHLPALDVFVLPSRFEGFPLSVIEAMLAEVPVVASDVGSVREAVLDGETGLLVPPDDPAALARALGELLGDPARRRAMGRRGRALALERYSAAEMARRFESLYDEICA